MKIQFTEIIKTKHSHTVLGITEDRQIYAKLRKRTGKPDREDSYEDSYEDSRHWHVFGYAIHELEHRSFPTLRGAQANARSQAKTAKPKPPLSTQKTPYFTGEWSAWWRDGKPCPEPKPFPFREEDFRIREKAA